MMINWWHMHSFEACVVGESSIERVFVVEAILYVKEYASCENRALFLARNHDIGIDQFGHNVTLNTRNLDK